MARVRRPSNLSVASKTPKAFIFIAIAAIAAAGYFIVQYNKGGEAESGEETTVVSTDRSSALYAPAIGPEDAPVVLAKWTDFQWPFCAKVGPTLEELTEHYGDKLRLEYHHYPLGFHKAAEPAAIASAAAQKQGKFWEMAHKLYDNYKDLGTADYAAYAAEIGLDVEQFKKDFVDPETIGLVRRDKAVGDKIGVRGTPSMFVNGRRINGRTLEDFKGIIDAELTATKALINKQTGVKAAVRKRMAAAPPNTDPKNAFPGGKTYLSYVIDDGKVEFSTEATPPPPPPPPVPKTVYNAVVNEGDPIKGPKDALVTIVEVSDFQWPFCSKVGPTLKKVRDTWPNDVRIVFKHRPLSFHDRAFPAAEASMAANAQGKFWEFHDKLFTDKKFTDSDLERYATEVGLDVAQYKADLKSRKFEAIVTTHDEQSVAIGATGTPAFFVNGRKLSGAKPFPDFKALIEEELEKAQTLVKDGVANADVYDTILKNAEADKAANAPPTLDKKRHSFNLRNSPSMGPKAARATFVVFSDFQWPFCTRLVKPMHDIVKEMKGQVRVVFKHFPLDSIHPQARGAAIATLAAHRQGKFWEYHDLLFENMKALKPTQLRDWAQVVGLDMAQFEKDIKDPALAQQVREDVLEGNRSGVRGTPSVFLNGRRVLSQGFTSVKGLKKILTSTVLK